MSKAEDRYLEHFQDGRVRNCSSKEAFMLGYHQAEKDLELGWEDILSILKIHVEVYEDETLGHQNKQEVCQEVLKRFKDLKNDTTSK